MWASLKKLGCVLDRADVWKLSRLLAVVAFMVLLDLLGIFSILPFMQVVANPEMIETNPWLSWANSTLGCSSPQELMVWVGCVILGIYAVTAVYSVLTTWLIHKTVWTIGHRISMRLLNRYTRLPFEFYLTTNSAELVKRVMLDIQSLVSGVLIAGSEFIASAFKSVVILFFLFCLSPGVALVAFVTYGGAYVLMHALRHRHLKALGRHRMATVSSRLRSFTEAVSGVRTLRVSGATDWFVNRFEAASQMFSRLVPAFVLNTVVPRCFIEFMAFGGIIVIILYMLLNDVVFNDVVPMLSVFAVATYKLLPALSQAFSQAATVSHNLPVIDAVHEDMQEDWELLKPTREFALAEPVTFERCLMLDGVSFQYAPSGIRVLTDINLTIRKSQKVAFVGSTGCGKSTLMDIMVGLLYPTDGRVLVDETPITMDNVFGWQKRIAYVPQDIFLCDASLADNIALGIPPEQIDWELLRKSTEQAQFDKFIQTDLKDGYDTVVGERGVRLSGGQRQRIGLARAFYRQPDVLFLDEATSALDSITEEAVVSAIEREMPDVTVVMIAHRLSSVKFCDELTLIDEGRIVDKGTFEKLMKSSVKFRNMVEITE